MFQVQDIQNLKSIKIKLMGRSEGHFPGKSIALNLIVISDFGNLEHGTFQFLFLQGPIENYFSFILLVGCKIIAGYLIPSFICFALLIFSIRFFFIFPLRLKYSVADI